MKEFKGKSIILAAPNHYGLLERFRENLEKIGFNTIIIPDDIKVKIGLKNTLIHLYKKLLKGDRSFKQEKKVELRYYKQVQLLRNEENIDYALFIRPDLFSNELISIVKNKVNIMCAYQWDGLDRFPSVYTKINLFDKFFVFDENDVKKNNKLIASTNFYFDDITSQENKFDIYFVGTYMRNRIDLILKLSNKFRILGLQSSINLRIISSDKVKNNYSKFVNIIAKPISFKENIINASQSRIILDFANDIHSGISMRTFESIGLRKKLITNNPLVKKYDFYHPNNIFVIENDKIDGIEEFIAIPYINLPEKIYLKYSFTNWIKLVFDIE